MALRDYKANFSNYVSDKLRKPITDTVVDRMCFSKRCQDHHLAQLVKKLCSYPKAAKLRTNTYTKLMREVGRRTAWEQAILLLDTTRQATVRLDTVACNVVVAACVDGGNWHQAIQLLSEMLCQSPYADILTFNSVIHALELQWVRALQIFHAIPAAGLTPNQRTFGAAIGACSRCSQTSQALVLTKEMKSQGHPVGIFARTELAAAFQRVSRWQESLRQITELRLEMQEPDGRLLTEIVVACGSVRHWAKTVQIFMESQDQNDMFLSSAVSRACLEGAKHTASQDHVPASAEQVWPLAIQVMANKR